MHNNETNFIGLNIKYLNDLEGVTKDEFGAMFGLNRGAISSYIKKESKPKYQTIQKISEKYNISIDDLLNKDLGRAIKSSLSSPKKLPEYPTQDNKPKEVEDPRMIHRCDLCDEKDERIKELKGQIEYFKWLIETQCLNRPLQKTSSGEG